MDCTFGANTHDFRIFKADGMVKNIKYEYLKKRTLLFHEIIKFLNCKEQILSYNFLAQISSFSNKKLFDGLSFLLNCLDLSYGVSIYQF